MHVVINGERRHLPRPLSVRALLEELGTDTRRVAVELNRRILKRAELDEVILAEGDELEVVHFVGGGSGPSTTKDTREEKGATLKDETLIIAGRELHSRLIVGTGKYKSSDIMKQCHEASGTEMVTVALRRVELSARGRGSMLDYIDTERISILPNTAGCTTADEAVRTARLAREAGLSNWVKLEVIGDVKTLFPDTEELLKATRTLVNEGFVVLPYTNDDVVMAKKLQDAGAAAVMPLGAPIGSGLGIQNANNIVLLKEAIRVPLIVDAGVGTASDATIAMELGADGVLMNTAIAEARDPLSMAKAMKLAVESGRLAYLAGRIPRKRYASASSPVKGVIGH